MTPCTFAVVTKTDACTRPQLTHTLTQITAFLKQQHPHHDEAKLPSNAAAAASAAMSALFVRSESDLPAAVAALSHSTRPEPDAAAAAAAAAAVEGHASQQTMVPVFLCSNVTAQNISLLRRFLGMLPTPPVDASLMLPSMAMLAGATDSTAVINCAIPSGVGVGVGAGAGAGADAPNETAAAAAAASPLSSPSTAARIRREGSGSGTDCTDVSATNSDGSGSGSGGGGGGGASSSDGFIFEIAETHNVPGSGHVVSGVVQQGSACRNDMVWLGPDDTGAQKCRVAAL